MYNDAVAAGGLRRAIRDAPPAETAVVARAAVPVERLAGADGLAVGRLAEALGDAGGTIDRVFRRSSLILPGLDLGEGQHGTVLASYPSLADHATLVDGHWPVAGKDPVEAVISTGASTSLAEATGAQFQVSDALAPDRTVRVVVVGTYQPTATDPYWLGDPLELEGKRTTTTFTEHGPIVVAPDDLVAHLAGSVQTEWRALPAIDRLRPDETTDLAARIEDARTGLPAAARGGGLDLSVSTNLPSVLTSAARASVVSRSSVTLLMVQFGVLGVYAVILVAGMIVERRRPEAALLRSRGATASHLIAMGVVEGLLIAVPAALVAPWLALVVVRLVGAAGPLGEAGILGSATVDGAVVAATLIAAVLSVLVFALPTVTSSRGLSTVRANQGRSGDRTLAQRLGIDIVLVVPAVIGLWQLRLYGSPITRDLRGALGLDPLLMVAPVIGLLAGAVLVTRLLPRAAELGERALATRRDLVPPLGAQQVARRPLRYTRAALLLVLAAALGTLAVTHSATWARSQADQAGYETGADVRVVASPYRALPSWADGPAMRSIPGVLSAMPVDRGTFELARSIKGGQLLGLDPGLAPDVISGSPGDHTALPPDLAADLAPDPSQAPVIRLDPEPDAVGVTVKSDLHLQVPDENGDLGPIADPAAGRLSLSLWLVDGDGRIQRFDSRDDGSLQETGKRFEVPLTREVGGRSVAPGGPLSLVGLEIGLDGPYGLVTGSVGVAGLDADAAPLALANGPGAWRWSRTTGDGAEHPGGSGDRPVTIGEPDGTFLGSDATAPSLRLLPATDVPRLRAMVNEAFLTASGTAIGDEVAITSSGRSIPLRVTGVATYLPSLDPTVPWVAVDGAALQRLV